MNAQVVVEAISCEERYYFVGGGFAVLRLTVKNVDGKKSRTGCYLPENEADALRAAMKLDTAREQKVLDLARPMPLWNVQMTNGDLVTEQSAVQIRNAVEYLASQPKTEMRPALVAQGLEESLRASERQLTLMDELAIIQAEENRRRAIEEAEKEARAALRKSPFGDAGGKGGFNDEFSRFGDN